MQNTVEELLMKLRQTALCTPGLSRVSCLPSLIKLTLGLLHPLIVSPDQASYSRRLPCALASLARLEQSLGSNSPRTLAALSAFSAVRCRLLVMSSLATQLCLAGLMCPVAFHKPQICCWIQALVAALRAARIVMGIVAMRALYNDLLSSHAERRVCT